MKMNPTKDAKKQSQSKPISKSRTHTKAHPIDTLPASYICISGSADYNKKAV